MNAVSLREYCQALFSLRICYRNPVRLRAQQCFVCVRDFHLSYIDLCSMISALSTATLRKKKGGKCQRFSIIAQIVEFQTGIHQDHIQLFAWLCFCLKVKFIRPQTTLQSFQSFALIFLNIALYKRFSNTESAYRCAGIYCTV